MFPGASPTEELTLDTIWVRFEEFSKPQSNEVRAHFDLLTSFQGNRNVDEWYNAVQTGQLSKVPSWRLLKSSIETYFVFL